jgi:hypothetical protein
LDLPTGFDRNNIRLSAAARAGLERSLEQDDAPYIVKQPSMDGPTLGPMLREGRIALDHVLLPQRDPLAAARSRVHVQELATGSVNARGDKMVRGGLWKATNEAEQLLEAALRLQSLVVTLTRHEIPMTWLWFPRMVRDPAYLFRAIAWLIPQVGFDRFRSAHQAVVRPDWVNSFTPDDY